MVDGMARSRAKSIQSETSKCAWAMSRRVAAANPPLLSLPLHLPIFVPIDVDYNHGGQYKLTATNQQALVCPIGFCRIY